METHGFCSSWDSLCFLVGHHTSCSKSTDLWHIWYRRKFCVLDHKYIVWDFLFLQLLQFPEGMTLHRRPASLAVESQVWNQRQQILPKPFLQNMGMNMCCGTQILPALFQLRFSMWSYKHARQITPKIWGRVLGRAKTCAGPVLNVHSTCWYPPSSAQHAQVFYFSTLRCYEQTPKFTWVMREVADVIHLIQLDLYWWNII